MGRTAPPTRRPHAACVVGAMLALLARAAGAAPGLDLALESGDRLRGTLDPAAQAEVVRLDLPRGAELRIRAFGRSAPLVLALRDATGADLATAAGRRTTLRAIARQSGLHAVVVRSADGTTPTDYRLAVTWRPQTSVTGRVALPAGGAATLPLALAAKTRVRIGVAPARGSHASPALTTVTPPDGSRTGLGKRAAAAFVASVTGEHAVGVEDEGGAGGDALVTARIAAPRARRRTLRATSAEIPPQLEVAAAAVMGDEGGRIAADPDGPLAGAEIEVPRGAFARATVVALGRVADLDPLPPQRAEPAGPALVACPVGATFDDATLPRVAAPVAPTSPARDGAVLRLVTAHDGAQPSLRSDATETAGALAATVAAFGACQAYWIVEPDVAPPFRLDGDAVEGAGTSLALAGAFVLVGAPAADGPAHEPRAGRVRVLERVAGAWIERAPLRAPSPAADAYFGQTLATGTDAVTGETIAVVGAPREPAGDDAADGALHVFTLQGATWVHVARIGGAPQRDGFGALLALDGDTLAASDVAEGRAPAFAPPTGTPRILRRTAEGWIDEARPAALPDLASVALDGDRLLGGRAAAVHEDGVWTFPLVVLERDGATWIAAAPIAEPSPGGWSRFGWSVAVDGDRVVASRFPDDADGWLGRVDTIDIGAARAAPPTIDVSDLRPTEFPWYHGSALVLRGDTLVAAAAIPALVTVHRLDGGAWRRDRVLSQPLPRGYAGPGGGPERFRASAAYDGRTLAGAWVVPHWSANVPTAGRVLVYDVRE